MSEGCYGPGPVEGVVSLGWHVLSGEHLLDLLRRAENGEDSADLLFAELWANAEHESFGGSE